MLTPRVYRNKTGNIMTERDSKATGYPDSHYAASHRRYRSLPGTLIWGNVSWGVADERGVCVQRALPRA